MIPPVDPRFVPLDMPRLDPGEALRRVEELRDADGAVETKRRGGKVVAVRGGQVPAVEYVEGCS